MQKLLLGISLSLMVTNAYAADAIVEDVVYVAPVFSWAGGYVGLQAGYSWGDVSYAEPSALFSELNSNPNPDGFLVGLYAGYNYQLDNGLVFGIEGDVDYQDGDDGAQVYLNPPGNYFGNDLVSDLKWTASGRLRAGYAVGRFLPFVTGGVAIANIENTMLFENEILLGSDDETLVGWTLGIGTEFAINDNWTTRVEYRYSDYGSEDFQPEGRSGSFDLETSDIRFGVAYKF